MDGCYGENCVNIVCRIVDSVVSVWINDCWVGKCYWFRSGWQVKNVVFPYHRHIFHIDVVVTDKYMYLSALLMTHFITASLLGTWLLCCHGILLAVRCCQSHEADCH